jgi:small subunit ribosomal protein S4
MCRRAGVKLFLKGMRCETARCAMERDALPPGPIRQRRPRRLTEYGLHLREVQRVKRHYGVFYKQFLHYFEKAEGQEGDSGDLLLQMLERRLDNVVYRMRLGTSRNHARQLILHGHVRVNGRKVTVPSTQVRGGDIVEPGKRDKSRKALQEALESRKDMVLPSWLSVEEGTLKGTVVQLPGKDELQVAFEPRLVVEYMAR